jgi:hypothetical protein
LKTEREVALNAVETYVANPTSENEKAAVDARATEAGPCFGYFFDGWMNQITGWGSLVIRDANDVLPRKTLCAKGWEKMTKLCPICDGELWAVQPEICECHGFGRVLV